MGERKVIIYEIGPHEWRVQGWVSAVVESAAAALRYVQLEDERAALLDRQPVIPTTVTWRARTGLGRVAVEILMGGRS